MALRTALFLCIACFAALGVLIIVSNHLYWSASPLIPGGEHILFDKPMPEPLGQIVWISLKPALLITLAATGVSLYHVIRRWRAGPPVGVCRTCGYDLRASPERCPECGTRAQ